ncbi:MAG TPA: DMT family transporter [Rickettsiales bacterium]|nr:DMT family transporter [Rickettsiales bacterium]
MQAPRLGVIVALTTAIIFGAHTPAERAVYAEGGNVALVMIATTFARAFVLVLYCLVRGRKLFARREDVIQAFWGGLCQAISVFALFCALVYLPAPVVIIICFTHTLMLLFFMAWRKEVALDTPTVLVTLSTLAGLVFVLDITHQDAPGSWLGIGLAFLSAAMAAARLYLYGHQMKERSPAVVGAENFIFALLFATLSLAFMPAPHLPSMLGTAWLGVACLALAFGTFCMFYGISLLGAFRYSLFAKTEPIFTAFYSLIFLHEVLKPQQYIGIAVVVGSLTLYMLRKEQKT